MLHDFRKVKYAYSSLEISPNIIKKIFCHGFEKKTET
jgi:hypothetical protein